MQVAALLPGPGWAGSGVAGRAEPSWQGLRGSGHAVNNQEEPVVVQKQ